MKNFVGLIILDGFGINDDSFGNAIRLANPENIIGYTKKYPTTTLHASGEYVGLPAGQMGNSEVGHLNIGAGRVVYQNLLKINNAIKTGEFYTNDVLLDAIKNARGNIHIMGLLSNGGVHSHIDHLFAIIDVAKKYDKKLNIHAIMDGRDTYREDGVKFIDSLNEKLKGTRSIISTICGRYYTMDRESNYDLIAKSYYNMTKHTGKEISDPIEYLTLQYDKGIYDEFIEPAYLSSSDTINSGDTIIFYNIREDRAKEITRAFADPKFDKFKTNVKNIDFVTMVDYDADFTFCKVMYPVEKIHDSLSEILSSKGLKQLKISETTKYAHVTYFLNGGIEEAYEGEDRILIETLKNVPFDKVPAMRAVEITDAAINNILTEKYDFLAINYSNGDMIGHTGNLEAATQAVSIMDHEVKRLVDTIISIGGEAIICADHGNCEMMRGRDGRILTEHTTNLVPCIIVTDKGYKLMKGCSLSSIAPTILDMFGIVKPASFTATSLIE